MYSVPNELSQNSIDVLWLHIRNANQASEEFIFSKKLDRYSYRSILGFHYIEKSHKCKKEDSEIIVLHKENHDKSFRQIEYAILIAILQKVILVLKEFDLLFDIRIDGDLKSNKTLSTVAIINQIFADLKHVAKLICNKIVMQYFNGCVYTANAKKADKKIDASSENELKYVQLKGLVKYLYRDHSLCWSEVC
ncbi:9820_t:CDS:2 [Funneliformis mosseae]|uniref:9820_t:CDS:1 n=1 Tax=Funneliformis mosseae TaxID=27381 RepID=A0A9N9GGA1_FUNMO|nr:9820_t:CDS:2 [Funneliformis mosseae]